ncbi:MAG: SDR family NAD(P)-dependent oxidoreductase [Cyclobacteriaceae bacterium]
MDIINNKILITGGSSGIGLALAIKLANLGNQVIITGRDRKKLQSISAEHNLSTFCCDLTKEDDIRALVAEVNAEHPDLNILINNAGIQYKYSFINEATSQRIDEETSTNLTAVMKLCAALIPSFLGGKESAIVNISSSLSFVPKRSAPVYSATKAGIHIFTKALRYQLQGSNIKVFEVIPPLVDTPMTEGRGRNKMSPAELVEEFIQGLEDDKFIMNIGRVKILKMIHRISPYLADSLVKNN